MVEFYSIAALLVLVAGLFVMFPVLLRHGDSASARESINVALFKDREQELQQERAAGAISEQQFEQLWTELQRRLLDEAVGEDVNTSSAGRPALLSSLLLVLIVGVAATLIYSHTGFKSDWDITQSLQHAREVASTGADASAETAELLALIDARLQQRPDQLYYQLLKGNLEMELGRLTESVASFDRLMLAVPNDPSVMSQALQVRFLSKGRRMDTADLALAERVLALDSRNVRTLGLLGINSFEQAQYADAIHYWQRLLPLVGPFSPNGKMIGQGVERARQMLAQSGGDPDVTGPEPADHNTAAATAAARLEVDVTLGEGIQAEPGASVFVYARAVNGPRMPLAVKRLTVAELPTRIVLDDSMAMAPGMNLSSFKQVEVVARISKNGIANSGSGDIEGGQGPIVVADVQSPIPVVINRVLP